MNIFHMSKCMKLYFKFFNPPMIYPIVYFKYFIWVRISVISNIHFFVYMSNYFLNKYFKVELLHVYYFESLEDIPNICYECVWFLYITLTKPDQNSGNHTSKNHGKVYFLKNFPQRVYTSKWYLVKIILAKTFFDARKLLKIVLEIF